MVYIWIKYGAMMNACVFGAPAPVSQKGEAVKGRTSQLEVWLFDLHFSSTLRAGGTAFVGQSPMLLCASQSR